MRVLSLSIAVLVLLVALSTGAEICQRGCPRIYDPICGVKVLSDGRPHYKTFNSRCEFEMENCLHPIGQYVEFGEEHERCKDGLDLE